MRRFIIECWDIGASRWYPVGTSISRLMALEYIQSRKDKGLTARYRVVEVKRS